MKDAGIRDSFARSPAPGFGEATGVREGTLVAVGAAVDVGTAVDVGGGATVGVGDPSHAAKINTSIAAPTSPRFQNRVALDFKCFTLLSVAGCNVDQPRTGRITCTLAAGRRGCRGVLTRAHVRYNGGWARRAWLETDWASSRLRGFRRVERAGAHECRGLPSSSVREPLPKLRLRPALRPACGPFGLPSSA